MTLPQDQPDRALVAELAEALRTQRARYLLVIRDAVDACTLAERTRDGAQAHANVCVEARRKGEAQLQTAQADLAFRADRIADLQAEIAKLEFRVGCLTRAAAAEPHVR